MSTTVDPAFQSRFVSYAEAEALQRMPVREWPIPAYVIEASMQSFAEEERRRAAEAFLQEPSLDAPQDLQVSMEDDALAQALATSEREEQERQRLQAEEAALLEASRLAAQQEEEIRKAREAEEMLRIRKETEDLLVSERQAQLAAARAQEEPVQFRDTTRAKVTGHGNNCALHALLHVILKNRRALPERTKKFLVEGFNYIYGKKYVGYSGREIETREAVRNWEDLEFILQKITNPVHREVLFGSVLRRILIRNFQNIYSIMWLTKDDHVVGIKDRWWGGDTPKTIEQESELEERQIIRLANGFGILVQSSNDIQEDGSSESQQLRTLVYDETQQIENIAQAYMYPNQIRAWREKHQNSVGHNSMTLDLMHTTTGGGHFEYKESTAEEAAAHNRAYYPGANYTKLCPYTHPEGIRGGTVEYEKLMSSVHSILPIFWVKQTLGEQPEKQLLQAFLQYDAFVAQAEQQPAHLEAKVTAQDQDGTPAQDGGVSKTLLLSEGAVQVPQAQGPVQEPVPEVPAVASASVPTPAPASIPSPEDRPRRRPSVMSTTGNTQTSYTPGYARATVSSRARAAAVLDSRSSSRSALASPGSRRLPPPANKS